MVQATIMHLIEEGEVETTKAFSITTEVVVEIGIMVEEEAAVTTEAEVAIRITMGMGNTIKRGATANIKRIRLTCRMGRMA